MTAFPLQRVTDALARAGLLVERRGELPDEALGIADDSRRVMRGGVFIAVRGSVGDGHDYLGGAEASGAVAAIVEDPSRTKLPAIVVRDGRRAAAIAAAAAYDDPARELRLVAVTGTNGKTTTVGILRHLLDGHLGRSASIGTLGVLTGAGQALAGGEGLTTPGPVELQRVLRVLADAGVGAVAMEVSSHSLDQRRVEGLRFDAGVFTNLTRDHLDYHGSMDGYLAAKAKLVEYLKPSGVAVVNIDDPAWATLPHVAFTLSVGVTSPDAALRATDVRYGPRGSEWTLCTEREAYPVVLPLIGAFNVANALAAAGAALALDRPLKEIASRLSTVPQVPGRLEVLSESPTVLRDYAHTPDALERALDAVRPFTRGRLTVVFGCGGDRDRGKRPEMGAIAARLADHVVLTSDNPRTEDPEAILDDIEAGMPQAGHEGRRERIEDRQAAIHRALEQAAPDDVIVLAGKGHETYQIRGTTKYPFDEKAIVSAWIANRKR